MTAFLERYFTISAWGPSANFDLLRLNFDWLRHPEYGYFSVTACLFGFGVYFAFPPYIEPDPEDFDFDAWVATTHVIVPTPEYDALVADAEAWRTRCKQAEAGEAEAIKYLHDFGPNVPVEDLGAEPIGWEKAP